MKNKFQLILLICFCTISTYGQNFEGTWEGTLSQGTLEYYFEISIDKIYSNKKFKGTSFIKRNNQYGKMKLTGVIRGNTLIFEETKILKQKRKSGRWCIKEGKLQITNNKKETVLKGKWTADGCRPGFINIKKKNLSHNQIEEVDQQQLNVNEETVKKGNSPLKTNEVDRTKEIISFEKCSIEFLSKHSFPEPFMLIREEQYKDPEIVYLPNDSIVLITLSNKFPELSYQAYRISFNPNDTLLKDDSDYYAIEIYDFNNLGNNLHIWVIQHSKEGSWSIIFPTKFTIKKYKYYSNEDGWDFIRNYKTQFDRIVEKAEESIEEGIQELKEGKNPFLTKYSETISYSMSSTWDHNELYGVSTATLSIYCNDVFFTSREITRNCKYNPCTYSSGWFSANSESEIISNLLSNVKCQ